MRLAGFDEYIAYVPGVTGLQLAFDTLSKEEYAEKYGFGMLTTIEQTAFVDPSTDPDPNSLYRNGLSPAEQSAYDEQLPECIRAAEAELGEPPGVLTLSEQTTRILDEASERAKSTREYIDAEQSWAPCMAKLGAFDYETRDDMREQLGATVERFAQPFIDRLNAAYSTSDLETARSLTMANVLSQTEYEEYVRAIETERSAALADLECGRPIDKAFESTYFKELEQLSGG